MSADLLMDRGAVLSPPDASGWSAYRYALWRLWDETKPPCKLSRGVEKRPGSFYRGEK